jgi:hypothetical protein
MTLGHQFEQLKMFMTPSEIMSSRLPLTADRIVKNSTVLEDPESLWERKLKQSKAPPTSPRYKRSLYDTIKREGVKEPVHLGPTQVTGGHHRIAAANDIAPDTLIPVVHSEEDRPDRASKVFKYT